MITVTFRRLISSLLFCVFTGPVLSEEISIQIAKIAGLGIDDFNLLFAGDPDTYYNFVEQSTSYIAVDPVICELTLDSAEVPDLIFWITQVPTETYTSGGWYFAKISLPSSEVVYLIEPFGVVHKENGLFLIPEENFDEFHSIMERVLSLCSSK